MQKAARLADICTGHDACPPRPSAAGSPDTTVNDRASLRLNDLFVPHGCNVHPPHPGKIAKGSSTVTINDKAAARVNDPIDCGGKVQTGSSDVLIGD